MVSITFDRSKSLYESVQKVCHDERTKQRRSLRNRKERGKKKEEREDEKERDRERQREREKDGMVEQKIER